MLLGVTKAPRYEDDEPVTLDIARSSLKEADTEIPKILANRIFFDPLDRENDNPDFWSLKRCRNEIEQLNSIPQQDANELFKTALTGDDQTKLKHIMRAQAIKLAYALEKDDYETAGKYWQSLARIKIIGNDEVEQMIVELIGMPLKNFVLRRIRAYEKEALLYNFEKEEHQLGLLRILLSHFPHEQLEYGVNYLQAVLRNS